MKELVWAALADGELPLPDDRGLILAGTDRIDARKKNLKSVAPLSLRQHRAGVDDPAVFRIGWMQPLFRPNR